METRDTQPNDPTGPYIKIIQYLIKWIQKDFIIIIICLITFTACFITWANIQHVIQDCNAWHNKEMQRCNCGLYESSIYDPQIKFTITGGTIENGSKNNHTYTQGTS